jgi:hypothetical protein
MSTYDLLIEKGKIEGKIEGKTEAITEQKQQFTLSLLNSTDFDDEKISLLVGVTITYVSDLRKSLKK